MDFLAHGLQKKESVGSKKEYTVTMRKTWMLIGVLAVLAIILVVFAEIGGVQKNAPLPTAVPTPTSVEVQISLSPEVSPTAAVTPSGDTVTISSVPVNNFYQTTTPFDAQGDRTIADVDNAYRIVYLAQYQQFLITINGSPFTTFRQQAENAFLQKMNLSQTDACKLDVVIRTPSFANPNEAGQDYRLSFCH